MNTVGYILKRTNITTGNQMIYYFSAILWTLVYTVLSFSLALILASHLSIFFVGLFTGLSSLFAIFIDIPFGYAQKIFRPRTLMVMSSLMVMATILIFIGSAQIILLAFLATTLYGLGHDLYDITAMTYIFKKSPPEEYSQNISQKNVAEALGVLVGLGLSSLIALSGIPELWILLVLSLLVSYSIFAFFDKAEFEVPVSEMDANVFKGQFNLQDIGTHLKDFLVSSTIQALISLETGAKAVREKLEPTKTLVLKPVQKEKYSENALIKEFKDAWTGIKGIFTPVIKWPLLWSGLITLFFSLWDTFIITFQPIFITKIVVVENHLNPGFAGIIIGLFIIPLFVFQVPFAKLADKWGKHFFMIGGLIFSIISMAMFGIFTDVFMVILGGFLNSIGYSASFPSAQAFFAQRFQENYAVVHSTQTMDANVSAAPLKLILNIGNVFARVLGGILIALLSFRPTFLFMGLIVLTIFLLSLIMYKAITKPILIPQIVPASETTSA